MSLFRLQKLDAFLVYLVQGGAGAVFFTMIFTVHMIYQVEKVGLNPLQLVLLGTTLEVSVLLFEIPTGVVADVYSRRLSVIIGFFIMGAGFVIEGVFPVFSIIVVSQILWGLGYTFTSGATSAWIADELGAENLTRVYLRNTQISHAGDLLGILGGVLLGSLAINLPIIVGGLGIMGVGVFLLLWMPENGFHPVPPEDRGSWGQLFNTFRAGLRLVRGRRALLAIMGIGLFFGLYSEGYDRLWTAHLLQNFTFPTLGGWQPVVWFGLMNAGRAILSITLSELLVRRVSSGRAQLLVRVTLVLSGLLVLALFGFAFSMSFVAAAALVLVIGVLRSTIAPLYEAWVNQHVESSVRATVLSMTGQVDAVGQIAGGPVVGWIGNTISIRAALATSALLLSPVLLLLGRLLRRREAVPAPVE
ncbi:MAG: MFS transporter [Anaerolineaceae bacterium]|nr:MFS transporter [Anaerolineaceae bacterium]